MKIPRWKIEDVNPDVKDNGDPAMTGKLKLNGAPVRECEDCFDHPDGGWMLLSEFPGTGRTWVCKVCQGFRRDPNLTAKADVGYKDYLERLNSINQRMIETQREYRANLAALKEEKRQLVAEQYAKYGKR